MNAVGLYVRVRALPGGRMKEGEVRWWRKVAGGLEQPPCLGGNLQDTEHAGAWLADCTCYPMGRTGTL